ncbi:hypothetical protein [Massilia sp. BJB1822]|uniref:hypothetical protein n=1 Tax=Massilia sp. BJB1822 TaxID=2744470 RepID=UPI0015934C62|nr:hypothetical protein [Massilia sp. BJB1822]NVD99639.1 hypothetical protein [Massilia sp. BJB1822]
MDEPQAACQSTLEQRFGSFDQRLGTLEKDVAVIKSNYATREDLMKTENRLIKWFVATSTALAAAAITAAVTTIRMVS